MNMGHYLRQSTPSLFSQYEDYITFTENVYINYKCSQITWVIIWLLVISQCFFRSFKFFKARMHCNITRYKYNRLDYISDIINQLTVAYPSLGFDITYVLLHLSSYCAATVDYPLHCHCNTAAAKVPFIIVRNGVCLPWLGCVTATGSCQTAG